MTIVLSYDMPCVTSQLLFGYRLPTTRIPHWDKETDLIQDIVFVNIELHWMLAMDKYSSYYSEYPSGILAESPH